MAKKLKIPPISAARRAIFEANGEEEHSMEMLHRSVYTTDIEWIKKRAAAIPVQWVDLEVTGNEILKDYYRSKAESRRRLAELRYAQMKWFEFFGATFKRNLGMYRDRICGGIDTIKFDADIGTPDGISTYDFVRQTYGDMALQCLEELVSGIPEQCEPVGVTA